MKYIKRILSVSLAAAILISNSLLPVSAEEEPSEKEEVIYIMTDAEGFVKSVTAVNIFDEGDVLDYGNYSAVKMLTSNDEIHYENRTVRYSSAQKTYYQGNLKSTVIPWKISIVYECNGHEVPAEEMAGRSGYLTIRFSVTKNDACPGNFFEAFGMQASFTLDASKCTDITAEGATIANAGKDKQISYTILPGKGLDATISAKVTDFEMKAVTINCLRMGISIDVDTSELDEKVDEITDAVNELSDGTDELSDGVDELFDGAEALSDGASELADGAGLLAEGVATVKSKVGSLGDSAVLLANGGKSLSDGLKELNLQSDSLNSGMQSAMNALCASAETTINTMLAGSGIPEISLTAANFSSVLTALEGTLGAGTASEKIGELRLQLSDFAALAGGVKAYTEAVGDAASGAKSLSDNLDNLKVGTSALTEAMETLSYQTKKLADGAKKLADGAEDLFDGVEELRDGVGELTDGVGEFDDKTSDMKEEVSARVDDMLAEVTAEGEEISSFVSEKNTNVRSVQFVIKTDAIEKPEVTVPIAVDNEKLTFFQKFLRLFGWD